MVRIVFYYWSRDHATPPSTTAHLAQSESQLSPVRELTRVANTVLDSLILVDLAYIDR